MIDHIVALSGGKDSTALALRLKELNPDVPYLFVCTPTGDELPPMQAHWERLRILLGDVVMLPNKTLEILIDEVGVLPNSRLRFCTEKLKLNPFFKFMELCSKGSIMYVGLRSDEPDRIGAILDNEDKFTIEYPFRKWNWGLPEIQAYLRCRGIEVPARTDCGACFYQRLDEWRDLYEQYPERYQRYVDMEERISDRRGRYCSLRSATRDTWPTRLRDLREEFRKNRRIRAFDTNRGQSFTACPWCAK
jgi:3'-phosphoadenosine 5'-phosphosulfate sulfotransferase (PAPS reductase)/FAD synthetase